MWFITKFASRADYHNSKYLILVEIRESNAGEIQVSLIESYIDEEVIVDVSSQKPIEGT